MKFISKRVLAVVLAAVMLLGLLPVGGLFAGAATTELFENGGFESGSMSGHWQSSTSATVVSDPVRSGSYAAKIEYGNGNMLQGYYNGLISGKTYTLSYWVYVPTGNSVQLQLMAQSINTSGSGVILPGYEGRYFLPISNNISAYDTWVQYTFEFTAGDSDAGFQFQLYSAQAGDLYYIDDVSFSTEAEEKTYIDIDFAVDTDVISEVAYNSSNDRTYLGVSTAQTLPVDAWGAYSGTTTLDIDGASVTAYAAGLGSANKMQVYTADNSGNFTGASKITIPAGTEFTSGNSVVRFVSDFIIVKKDGVWVKYEEEEVVTPTDHGGDTELDADAISVGPVNGDFSATSDNNNYMGNSSKADGMAKIDATGTDDYIQFNSMTVEAGKEYTLAFYVWIVGANADFKFNVYMTSAGSPKGSWLDYAMNDTTYVTSVSPAGNITADTAGWQRVAITWTAPASGALNFGLKNYGATGEGTIYIDDVSVTTMPVAKTYIDIDFAVDTDVISSVAYNSTDKRTYLVVQTAQTLPVDGWGAYSGTTTLDIDGVSVSAAAAGMANANRLQIYVSDTTVQTDFSSTASKITIPAGAEFTSGDSVVRFVSDFIIVKKDGAWVKYEEEQETPVVTPTDHTTSDYPEIPDENTNLAAGGDFTSGIPSGMSATSGLVTAADGMAIVTGNSTLVTVTSNSVAAGHTYTYTMYYWATDLSGSPQFLVQAYYVDANGETGYKVKYSGGLSVGENWTKLTFDYTIPETASDPYRLSFQIQSIEKASVAGTTGTLYVDDISLYDQNEETKTYIDIAPNNGSVKLDSVGYNSGNSRSFIILETTETLPVANWATYSGSAYVNFDGTDVKVGFAGNNDANQFQIYVNDSTVTDDFGSSASTIVIPANTEFASGNTVVRVTEAITLVNNYGIWMIDDPNAPEYQPIYAYDVVMFAAVDQGTRNVFGFAVYGVEIPFNTSWANFGYNPVLIDGEEVAVAFGTTDTDATWGMGEQNKFLVYTEDGVYSDAQEMIIPAGTVLVHPADDTLAYLFTEDVVITKTADGIWPIETLLGAQVALGDTLKSDVTIRIPAALYLDGMQLQYTVNGATATADLTATGADQLYTATLSTAAKNVTDTYTLQLVDAYGNPVGVSVEYSVADYANRILESYIAGENIYTEAEMNAAANLLLYARYAQDYFGYKTDDPAADIWIDEAAIPEIDALIAEVADMTATATDNTFVGCSLLLKDTTAIRLYFSEQHEGTLSASNGLYYVDITGIGALDLDKAYEVAVNGVTYNVSVLSLCKKVVASTSTSDAFKMVARSLYAYWMGAEDLANA